MGASGVQDRNGGVTIISDLLQVIDLDMEELLHELRLHWKDNPNYLSNTTALSKLRGASSDTNIMMCCPMHNERNPSCGILTDYPYTWNCFGCGASGNIGQLVAHVLDLPTEVHGEHYLTRNYLQVSTSQRPPIDIEGILNKEKEPITVPEEEVAEYCKKRHPYILERGFKDRALQEYEVGFDVSTGDITIPIRTSKGDIRFITRRSVYYKRFSNDKDIPKKDIVFGLYNILRSGIDFDTMYLTESALDTISCYQGGLIAGAINGRLLFKEQVRELQRAGVKVVNTFFDNDKAGVECAIRANYLLSQISAIRVNYVKYPSNNYGIDTIDDDKIKYKDANDLMQIGKLKEIQVISFEEYLLELKEAKLIDVDQILNKKYKERIRRDKNVNYYRN